ncbi:hypothetical protein GXB85_15955 [Cellulomonas sp. APG4]|uniref:hypothetical protein n=1 Tax=Cellulomonas sp. APG4 TaxID=1538656 RepID=UPI001379774E|nr:hypothetical protein [Cellulomonas sp. APG4]NCT92430.1 hypothetical protein [Cellulomonas sp. APG4]
MRSLAWARGESFLSGFAAGVVDLMDTPRSERSRRRQMWRAFWEPGGQGHTPRHQHRAAGFGWLILCVVLSILAFGTGYALDAIGGKEWGDRYGELGIPGVPVLTPIILCVYHFLASLLMPAAPPGPLARWSISWATDLAAALSAILIAT